MATCATTTQLEPVELQARPPPEDGSDAAWSHGRDSQTSRSLVEAGGVEPDPAPRVEAAQKWNEPFSNVYRLAACFWSMFVMGANDAAYGALIPSLQSYYGLSYTVVSVVFISPFVGYVASALLINWLHLQIGQRGISLLASGCHVVAYVVIAVHPPYVVLIFAFIFAGFANGLGDAAWNAWIGSLASASELLGFLHALYGVGGVMSPLVSTSMTTKANLPWHTFYYIMLGISVVEMGALVAAFWHYDGARYRNLLALNNIEKDEGLQSILFRKPGARTSWLCAFFLLCYVGVEVALGGWIVTFMSEVRHGESFASGMTATGFWLGITVGRAILGFVTPRLGVKTAVTVYIAAAMALELLFWLVPHFYVSAVAVAFQGFFLGPLFPGVVLVASQLLPRHQHVLVIGFSAAFGGCGAALLPFLVGLLAQASGVKVLQPIILALLGVMLVLWLSLPRIDKRRD